jgi:pimeloyl-ACP methyl ester carboxylesterase
MIEQPASESVRSKIIESRSYGLINCLEVGEYGQPLILVIHGSGPKNSAKTYEFFLYEYIARISFLERFYIIAIDCPGYGQSTGSKEAIKTFPRQLLEEILEALHYNNYFILMGHSQGGAAIFNAVH